MTPGHLFSRREFAKASTLALAGLALDRSAWAADIKTDYQIACYTRCFDQYEYGAALDGIAEAGYKYVGILTAKGKGWVIITTETTPEEANRIGGEVLKRGLKALSVFGDFAVNESVEQGIRGLRRLIDNCRAAGSPNLLLGGTNDEKIFENYYKAITECCAYAREKNVALSVKPHGGQNATGPQCRQVIEKVNQPNFRLWYDPGNIFYYSDGKLDPVDDSKQVDGLVVGMSVKDFQMPKEVLLTPGTGMVNFPKVMENLKKGGFVRGPLIVECVKRGELAEVTAEARKARVFLENLIASK